MTNLQSPLAERLRPSSLDKIIGQEHLIGPNGLLSRALASNHVPSIIFWGPPGCGKTTLARALGEASKAEFHYLSAVLTGIRELRDLVTQIEKSNSGLFATKHILFIDEIHRWNKAQQDALLPYVEHGLITLIGATTENPSFEIISPLLSRCKVYLVNSLKNQELKQIALRALDVVQCNMSDEAINWLINYSSGDARRLINTVESAAFMRADTASPEITLKDIVQVAQKKHLRHDKKGEDHYNLISAFIKSMRASDPNATIYYLARMYEAGEDPRFLARRMVIFAAEDISLAKPAALPMAVAAFQAYEIIGEAEGWIPLSQAAIYLALAPKSNETYVAYKAAKAEIEVSNNLPVPLHLRNAPTRLMKDLGYGENYHYPHDEPEAAIQQDYLPDEIVDHHFYRPKNKI